MEKTTENMAAVEKGSDLQDTTSASPIDPNDVAGGLGSCTRSILGGGLGGFAGGGFVGTIGGVAGGVIAGCPGPGMFSTGTGNIGNDVTAA